MSRDLLIHVLRASRAVTLAAFLGGWLQSASGQTRESTDPTTILRERLDPKTLAAVQELIDSTAANGLPTGPLVSKALEGSAKHAEGTRIVAAVRLLSADLAVAQRALGPNAAEETLVAAVGALRAGTPAAYLSELRASRRMSRIAWPLTVLADLVSRGVPVDTAAGVVLDLARAGATDASYTALQEQIRQDVSAGVPAGAAAATRSAAVVSRIGPTRPPLFGLPRRPARPDVTRP